MVHATGETRPKVHVHRVHPGLVVIALACLASFCVAAFAGGCNGQVGATPSMTATPDKPQGAAGPINPGRVVAHRLNNVEYDNTVRDLIGADLKPSSELGFPDDAYVEGFDNNA